MPACDPNVFDAGFTHTTFAVPFMQYALIGRGFKRVVAGSNVPIQLAVQELDSTFGRLYSMNPEGGAYVQILYPPASGLSTIRMPPFDGGVFDTPVFHDIPVTLTGVALDFTRMVGMSLGSFLYQYASSVSQPTGFYTGRFKMVNGDKTTVTEEMFFFELIAPIVTPL